MSGKSSTTRGRGAARARVRDARGSFLRPRQLLSFLDERRPALQRLISAQAMLEEALPGVSRQHLIAVRSHCLDAALECGDVAIKQDALEAIDDTVALRRVLARVVRAMDGRGATPEARARFPAGLFPGLFGDGGSEFTRLGFAAAPAVRRLAAAAAEAEQVLLPIRPHVKASLAKESPRKYARELAFVAAMKEAVARDSALEGLLHGSLPYLFAAACGLAPLPGPPEVLRHFDALCATWRKRTSG